MYALAKAKGCTKKAATIAMVWQRLIKSLKKVLVVIDAAGRYGVDMGDKCSL